MALPSVKDDADQPRRRRMDEYGLTLLTGVATMDADVMRRVSALVAPQCPGQAQMLYCYQPDTLG
jgi:hypothetical protein